MKALVRWATGKNRLPKLSLITYHPSLKMIWAVLIERVFVGISSFFFRVFFCISIFSIFFPQILEC